MKGGKAGTIDLVKNPSANIHKDKAAGHLVVVSLTSSDSGDWGVSNMSR